MIVRRVNALRYVVDALRRLSTYPSPPVTDVGSLLMMTTGNIVRTVMVRNFIITEQWLPLHIQMQ